MSKDLNKVQTKVFSSEFREFCKKRFSKDMIALEEERKKALLCVFLIIVVLTVVFALVFFCFYKSLSADMKNVILGLYFFLLAFVLIPIHLYKAKAKSTIMPKLLAFVGDFKFVDELQSKSNVIQYVRSLNLFERYNDISIDDVLEGIYNDIKVSISEICLKYKYTTTRRNKNSGNRERVHKEKIIFKGVLLSFKSFKKFKSRTVIKSDHIKLFQNSKQVHLEDPEFEKMYDVESEDQIEARYLITPAFMNRVVEYSKSNTSGKITISFENENVNIAVHSNKNWFDIPILQPATNVSIYTNILLELISILKIIDALKMEQNIGM